MTGGTLLRMLLREWSALDLPVLERCRTEPAMVDHLGGPEDAAGIARRQARYEQPGSHQFAIIDPRSGLGAGWVGFWEREWMDEQVYEVGWAVLPEFQGQGLATAGVVEVATLAALLGDRSAMHAYPFVENGPSNAVCRKAGFRLRAEVPFEFPAGNPVRVNDWRLEIGRPPATLEATGL